MVVPCLSPAEHSLMMGGPVAGSDHHVGAVWIIVVVVQIDALYAMRLLLSAML